MNDSLISMFIDNELDLDEKVEFVETVHADKSFTFEVVKYLNFEKLLQKSLPQTAAIPETTPVINRPAPRPNWSLRLTASCLAGCLVFACLGVFFLPKAPQTSILSREHRFVLYLPQANEAEIIGTFTDWAPVPMERIGSTGYWTLTLEVPYGEHRYSYVIENEKQITDPTVVAKEHDDFGGENTVIQIGDQDDSIS